MHSKSEEFCGGMLMMCGNYPMYRKILASRKEKYAGEIIELSEKIMNVE